MSALASLQIRSGVRVRPSCRRIRIFGDLAPLHHVVIRQHEKPRVLVAADDDARPGLLELPDPLALLVPGRLLGHDVHDRRRDGPGDQLEHPVDVREVLVFLGELIVDLAVLPADLGRSSRRPLGRGWSRPDRRPPPT